MLIHHWFSVITAAIETLLFVGTFLGWPSLQLCWKEKDISAFCVTAKLKHLQMFHLTLHLMNSRTPAKNHRLVLIWSSLSLYLKYMDRLYLLVSSCIVLILGNIALL